MENDNLSNSDKLKNSLCYVPLVGIVLFFTEEHKGKILMKHIKYGTFLFGVFVLVQFLFVGVFRLPVGAILFLIYAGITGFLGWKAYNGEDINLEYVDDFEQRIKDNLNDNEVVKKENTTETKTENTTTEKKNNTKEKTDDDVLDF
ncbi:MAG: hypothetical protein QM490_01365 [Candidatus Gracilibacteria bacterium]